MKKFAVFSGFLGSGKTTTMISLMKHYEARYGKAAMISNDLGGQGLADRRFAVLRGCNASELTDDCICYQTENLVERLNYLFDEADCELVVSDIPGFGVGALEHVYHTLNERYPGKYELAPFTVIVEPGTVEMLRDHRGGDIEYIFHTQLVEADLIVLNKQDLLNGRQLAEMVAYLEQNYCHARVITISALQSEGVEDLAYALRNENASMQRPDIGYGGEAFVNAMSGICEYNIQYHAAVCCNDFDGNEYLMELAKSVQSGIADNQAQIPHMKILAWEPEGEYTKVDLLGTDRPVEVSGNFTKPSTEMAVVINASAVCPLDLLDDIITEAVEKMSEKYQLSLSVFKKECI